MVEGITRVWRKQLLGVGVVPLLERFGIEPNVVHYVGEPTCVEAGLLFYAWSIAPTSVTTELKLICSEIEASITC